MLSNSDRVELDRVLTPMLNRLTELEETVNGRRVEELADEVRELRTRVERVEAMLAATTSTERSSLR